MHASGIFKACMHAGTNRPGPFSSLPIGINQQVYADGSAFPAVSIRRRFSPVSGVLGLSWLAFDNMTTAGPSGIRPAPEPQGGGVVALVRGGQLIVAHCSFTNCSIAEPPYAGGAIFIGNGATANLSACTFIGNRASYGGAIGLMASEVHWTVIAWLLLSDCTFRSAAPLRCLCALKR